MRFEIRAGGALATLIGLAALSGAVFVLGLVAGYEMGQQQESNRQFATIYPLPEAPAVASSPSPSVDLSAAAAPSIAAPLSPPLAAETPAAAGAVPPVANASPLIAPPPTPAAPSEPPLPNPPVAVATPAAALPAATPAPPPAVAKSAVPAPAISESAKDEPEITAPAQTRAKGYSIQIQAAMDRSGAEAMVAKLHNFGYSAYMVETLIGGQTWYRVRVGPF